MGKVSKAVGILIFVIILWHVKQNTKWIHVTGLFQVKPNYGLVWKDNYKTNARYFWDNNNTSLWKSGTILSPHHAIATNVAGVARPERGYRFINDTSFNTVWTPGAVNLDDRVYSSEREGDWIAFPGYKLSDDLYRMRGFSGDIVIKTVWDPGQRLENLKITASRTEGKWLPFPGYVFTNSAGNLSVKWVPGLPNPDNALQVSGLTEGEWVFKSDIDDDRTTGTDVLATYAFDIGVSKLAEWFFGKKSMITDAVKETAIDQSIDKTKKYLNTE